MKRIAFVNPLSIPFDVLTSMLGNSAADVRNITHEGVTLPMGIIYLSSYLKQHLPEVQVELIDYRRHFGDLMTHGDLDRFIDDVARSSTDGAPDVVAFSVIVPSSHAFFRRCLSRLAQLWPNAEIIVGGGYATNYTSALIDSEDVDAVFRGEAELSLTAYLAANSAGERNSIPGVVTKANRGLLPYSLSMMLPSMDGNPMPDYELVDMLWYVTNNSQMGVAAKEHKYSGVRSASIMTSLGCPFRCTFCASHTIHGRKLRYKSIENTIAEIRYLYERWGVTFILPNDDLFVASKKRTLALLEAMRGLHIPNLILQCPASLSVNILDEELIDALTATGMDLITISIESGSDYVQREIIEKSVKLDKAKRLVAYARSKNVPIRAVFILGFPGETQEQMHETIDYAVELGADWNLFFVATPIPGSKMFDQFAGLGYIPSDIDVLTDAHFAKRTFDTQEASAAETTHLVYYANLLTNFAQNVNLRLGKWEAAIEAIQPIAEKYPFHLLAADVLAQCHRQLGNPEQARHWESAMSSAVKTDQRAKDMLHSYSDLLSEHTRNLLTATDVGAV